MVQDSGGQSPSGKHTLAKRNSVKYRKKEKKRKRIFGHSDRIKDVGKKANLAQMKRGIPGQCKQEKVQTLKIKQEVT